MKELLREYAAYNAWASQRIIDVILALPEEKQLAEIPSSYNSLYKTVLHIWDAESGWWQRMKLQERVVFPSENENGTFKEISASLIQQSKQWEEWVNGTSDQMLEHVFQYHDRKGTPFKMPIYQMIHHVFNHGTYHRGQLINMLRQLGVDKLPSTDFSLWARGKK
ncbi:MAG: DinB family protein [Chitinophagaceae bacterium]